MAFYQLGNLFVGFLPCTADNITNASPNGDVRCVPGWRWLFFVSFGMGKGGAFTQSMLTAGT